MARFWNCASRLLDVKSDLFPTKRKTTDGVTIVRTVGIHFLKRSLRDSLLANRVSNIIDKHHKPNAVEEAFRKFFWIICRRIGKFYFNFPTADGDSRLLGSVKRCSNFLFVEQVFLMSIPSVLLQKMTFPSFLRQ